ncbi:Uma2 family endonuclease [Tautonia marina]|uniref:Uma2 family endonuclease n=1 Tax=Tautonia marina TaxID=2653855 RepID=UPI001F187469|nr:Uma2 family endonuclease [Tautonia marina]
MATSTAPSTIATDPPATIAELLHLLGDIPASRVRFRPLPGSATEEDLLRLLDRENLACELIEGVLVEKARGYRESLIAGLILTLLNNHVLAHRLGYVSGADGIMRLMPQLVRIPDVAFVARNRFPGGKLPDEPIPSLVPNLAVEVLSKDKSRAEMERKIREYFEAGVRLVWMVDPTRRTVRVHPGPTAEQSVLLSETETLDGGEVVTGFSVTVTELFPTDDD